MSLSTLRSRFQSLRRRMENLLRTEIWKNSPLQRQPDRPNLFSLLRIFIIAFRTIGDNRLFGQAAALSYYTLIGLGPLLAIAIMISGFVLERSERDLAVDSMTRVLLFVAPPAAEWAQADFATEDPEEHEANGDEITLNPELLQLVESIFEGARSGAVGILGSLILIIIVIQMITSVEKSFNEIWGVKRGRSLIQRVVSYWTMLSLGAVLAFAALALLSVSRVASQIDALAARIPFFDFSVIVTPLISLALLTLLLSLANRFFPNTHVFWKPALVGGALAAVLLYANHTLSFIYVERVITQQSLYGSVGIIPVLMLGIYVFWLIVLLGGIFTYAIQNVHNLTNERAWNHISVGVREKLTLATVLIIARRFRECESPPSSAELARALNVPVQVLNSCLSQLVEMGWVSPVVPGSDDEVGEARYQPGRPLNTLNLGHFQKQFREHGNNSGMELLRDLDPILSHYRPALRDFELEEVSLEKLLGDFSLPETESSGDES